MSCSRDSSSGQWAASVCWGNTIVGFVRTVISHNGGVPFCEFQISFWRNSYGWLSRSWCLYTQIGGWVVVIIECMKVESLFYCFVVCALWGFGEWMCIVYEFEINCFTTVFFNRFLLDFIEYIIVIGSKNIDRDIKLDKIKWINARTSFEIVINDTVN